MNHDAFNDLAQTISGLETGLTVGSIMSHPLACVRPADNPHTFFSDHAHFGFDCAPVKDDDRIIGMVYKTDLQPSHTSAREAMRPLDRVPLIASSASISSLIRLMQKTNEHFWLVLHDTSIDAIVTRADLARLPVRLLAISRVIHLEQLLAFFIREHLNDDQLLSRLPPGRQGKIRDIIESKRAKNEELDAVEATSFSDKITILKSLPEWTTVAEDLGGINALRDQLMHARDADTDESGIAQFLDRLGRLDRYIQRLTDELTKAP